MSNKFNLFYTYFKSNILTSNNSYTYFKNNYLNGQYIKKSNCYIYGSYQIDENNKITKLYLPQIKTENEAIKLSAYIEAFKLYNNFIVINNVNNKLLFNYMAKLNGQTTYYLINHNQLGQQMQINGQTTNQFYTLDKYITRHDVLRDIIICDI